jgi:long-subunit fatty acid transport protein
VDGMVYEKPVFCQLVDCRAGVVIPMDILGRKGASMKGSYVLPLTALAALITVSDVRAGGFEIPGVGARSVGRGGAFTVLADDLSAVANNPGALTRLTGTHFLYSHNLIWHPASFTRAKSQIPQNSSAFSFDPEEAALKTVSEQSGLFPLGVMLVVATDFGLPDWRFALSIFGPNAAGGLDYPVQGGQRYLLTHMEMLLIYYNLTVAYGKQDKYGVGVTLQYAHVPVSKYSLVVDGVPPGGDLSPYNSSSDVETTLDMSDPFAFTATIGAWWRVLPSLEIGLSGRVIPLKLNPRGKVSLANVPNQTQFNARQLSISNGDKDYGAAGLDLTLPVTARAGVRYRHLTGEGDSAREVFDIELNFVYEGWSSIEAFEISLKGDMNLFASTPIQNITMEKRWKDTLSVRLGSTFNVVEDTFSMSLGGFYETGAVPHNYTNLDFLSFDRFGIGAGIRLRGYGLELNVSYMHVFQGDRDVSELFGKIYQQRPVALCPESCDGLSGVPANAGLFTSSFDILSLSLQAHFDKWF